MRIVNCQFIQKKSKLLKVNGTVNPAPPTGHCWRGSVPPTMPYQWPVRGKENTLSPPT